MHTKVFDSVNTLNYMITYICVHKLVHTTKTTNEH